MGRITVWLSKEYEDAIREASNHFEMSISGIATRAIEQYFDNLSPKEKKEVKKIVEKLKAGKKLKNLREEGRVIQREIVYGSKNVKRALDALEDSELSKKDKEYWKGIIENHSRERMKEAKKLVDKPKEEETTKRPRAERLAEMREKVREHRESKEESIVEHDLDKQIDEATELYFDVLKDSHYAKDPKRKEIAMEMVENWLEDLPKRDRLRAIAEVLKQIKRRQSHHGRGRARP